METLFEIIKQAVNFFYNSNIYITVFLTWILFFMSFYLRVGVREYALLFATIGVIAYTLAFGIILPSALMKVLFLITFASLFFLVLNYIFT